MSDIKLMKLLDHGMLEPRQRCSQTIEPW